MAGSETHQRGSTADYLASERTLLAWLRTGLALMAFGFVVARFGLFLQQLAAIQHADSETSSGLSLWFGTVLIVAGVIVNLASAARHVRIAREIDVGEYATTRSTWQAIATSVFLGLVGIGMAVYLLSVRQSTHSHSQVLEKEATMAIAGNNGIVAVPSNHSVDETVDNLKAILQSKSVTLFALVDHSGEAQKVGMKMPPTKLLIFGSPQAGTPLMLAAPSIAIDLPLKVLVSEDAQGKVWISYNSPEYLENRHHLPHELLQNIAVVAPLAAKAAE